MCSRPRCAPRKKSRFFERTLALPNGGYLRRQRSRSRRPPSGPARSDAEVLVESLLKRERAVALTIAGLDPSGGAGILADLTAFRSAGAWGCCVCTALTAQSPHAFDGILPVDAAFVRRQLTRLIADVRICAVKIGAIGSPRNVLAIARALATIPNIPVVLDPVVHATRARSTRMRLDGGAGAAAMKPLLRRATLITPNVHEAEALLGRSIRDVAQARQATLDLLQFGSRFVLLKGGHLRAVRVVDHLATQTGAVHAMSHVRRETSGGVHGTGCLTSSLITGWLSVHAANHVNDRAMLDAVLWARRKLQASLRSPKGIGKGQRVLMMGA